jgi:hypothetical protein
MTPERARRIIEGLGISREENLGRIIMPMDVFYEFRDAGLIDEKGNIRVDALEELAKSLLSEAEGS